MNEFRQLEHSGWTTVADDYDSAFARLTTQSIPALLDAVQLRPGLRLLDVACGPGYVTAAAAARGASVVGLDFSTSMLQLGRGRHPELEFIEGDAESLDFPDTSFDAVTMNFGVLHLDRPDKAIAEAARVLRPGGRLAFTVWAPPEQAQAFGIVLGAVSRHGDPSVPLPPGPPFFHFSSSQNAATALEAAGLADPQSSLVPQTWHFSRHDELFDCMMTGTVRTRALLQAQQPAALASIRTGIAEALQAFRVGDHYELPMPSVLSRARKAGERP